MSNRQVPQLPEFSLPDNFKLPTELRFEDVRTFLVMYRSHCQQLIDTVSNSNFEEVERQLKHFWQEMPNQFRIIACNPAITDVLIEKDQSLYNAMITAMLPDVLQPAPVSVPQDIREFATSFEDFLQEALKGHSPALVEKKLQPSGLFVQGLQKQASLHYLVQTTRAVLQNGQQIQQMLQDWDGIDFEFVQHQASWLCHDGEEIAVKIRTDFKRFLEQRSPVESYAQWLRDIIDQFLKRCTEYHQYTAAGQQLLLKWAFYSSLIIRDLTVRNAASFGSFHLLRTLFDEYLSYVVDRRLSAINIPPSVKQEPGSTTTSTSAPPPVRGTFGTVNIGPGSLSSGPSVAVAPHPVEAGIDYTQNFSKIASKDSNEFSGNYGRGSFFDTSNLNLPNTFARPFGVGGSSDDWKDGRKTSGTFGSFGSFSSEFSRSLFRGSFDRGSVPQLFYNLATPGMREHAMNFGSFSTPGDSLTQIKSPSAGDPPLQP
eukprot:TRINITY_DN2949_c0_g1_i2.p1 TRINITY_DN2949_c0_g1~~TRINITY_DN2949_c0_g1_i2.p1  ORF type:complete len:484 (+),score=102.20 TRINITY_DN2949_c0_g1_i2:88-1539(+)